jgi:pSer/pThr/pTyr-binding forkhead associated (FHA) protein
VCLRPATPKIGTPRIIPAVPRLLIRTGFQGHQKVELGPGETIIGRGEDATVMFPNVSVSRHHCLISVGTQRIVLEDMDSANGTFLNGKQVMQEELKTGDEIQVGKFHLVYLDDGKDNLFYRGRYVKYLAKYEPVTQQSNEDSTFAMSKEAIKALANQNALVEDARLVLTSNPRKFWFPEDRKLTFGTRGMIDVSGWWTWGECAEVAWDGSRHTITRKGFMTSVKVNDQPVSSKRPLKEGDNILIGKTRFQYTLG